MTARLVDQSGQTLRLIAIQPVVEGIGMTRFEQTMQGDGVRGGAIGHFEQRRRAGAQVGAAVVITGMDEFSALGIGEGKGASIHAVLLSRRRMLPLPD
jgi:hypothetical protein